MDTIQEPPAYCKLVLFSPQEMFIIKNIMFSCSMLQNLFDRVALIMICKPLSTYKGMSYSPSLVWLRL